MLEDRYQKKDMQLANAVRCALTALNQGSVLPDRR